MIISIANISSIKHKVTGFLDRNAGLALSAVISAYFAAIVIGTHFLRVEPWHDENHYLATVRLFVNSFSLNTVKSYVEMHPPLAYMLYALAGIGFGDHVWIYRIVTMVCALVTLCALFAIMRRVLKRDILALAVIALFIANPYVVGLSVFVFSDIPGMMFLTLAVLAALNKRYWLFGLAAAASLLCRQYNVFAPAAIALWAILDPQTELKKEKLRFSLAALLCLVPIIVLFLFWGDIAPPNGMKYWNPDRIQGFHPDFTVAYITMFAIYAAPVSPLPGVSYSPGLERSLR
jgi:predicted membrane-bound dolichyl-phosphate-mannose-protein mannosyltransferase